MLGISPSRIRSFVRAGLLTPRRGARGSYRFSFQDLVLLRTASELSNQVPPRRLRRALMRLQRQLPRGRDLTALRITASGEDVIVQDGRTAWEPDSGQMLLSFEVAEIAAEVAPLVQRAAEVALADQRRLEANDWYELGCDLEVSAPASGPSARDAYRRALELDPDHVEAHVNLGRILHADGSLQAAAAHYRAAVRLDPTHAVALYNLGVLAEDSGDVSRAMRFYRKAIRSDPEMADAHTNLALLHEAAGNPKLALRHLAIAHRLMKGR